MPQRRRRPTYNQAYGNLPTWAQPPKGTKPPLPKPANAPPAPVAARGTPPPPPAPNPKPAAAPAPNPKPLPPPNPANLGGNQDTIITKSLQGGSGGAVMLLSTLLLIVSMFKTVFYPLLNTAIAGAPLSVSSANMQLALGGVVFVVILSAIATNDQYSGAVLLFVVGLWLVYMIMNGTGAIQSAIVWLEGGANNLMGNAGGQISSRPNLNQPKSQN